MVKLRGFRCWSRGKKIKYFDPVFWCGPGWCVLLEFRMFYFWVVVDPVLLWCWSDYISKVVIYSGL